MNVRPSILCPIDFSEASGAALRYAAAIASHFGTRLIVLTVDDPLLAEAAGLTHGLKRKPAQPEREMADFAAAALGAQSALLTSIEYDVAVGKPAPEILRTARERSCDLIVLGTHGLTGMRKRFFGSTTERVLRETRRPVLTVPPAGPGAVALEDAPRIVRRILAPVDFSPGSRQQALVAEGLARALHVPLILAHVIEPVRSRLTARQLAGIESARRAGAEEALQDIARTLTTGTPVESLVVYGDPAEELAKVAHDRDAGLIVICLHTTPLLGPRMGSVTYRMLCLVPSLVLALPPAPAERGNAITEAIAASAVI